MVVHGSLCIGRRFDDFLRQGLDVRCKTFPLSAMRDDLASFEGKVLPHHILEDRRRGLHHSEDGVFHGVGADLPVVHLALFLALVRMHVLLEARLVIVRFRDQDEGLDADQDLEERRLSGIPRRERDSKTALPKFPATRGTPFYRQSRD